MMNNQSSLLRPLLPILCLMLLTLPGCEDNLKTIANHLQIMAEANLLVQKTVIEANRNNVISDDVTRPIIDATMRIALVGLQASTLTRSYSKLNEDGRGDLLLILEPVLEVIENIINDETLSNIRDDDLRDEILLSILLIRTSLTTVQAILEAT